MTLLHVPVIDERGVLPAVGGRLVNVFVSAVREGGVKMCNGVRQSRAHGVSSVNSGYGLSPYDASAIDSHLSGTRLLEYR